VDCEARHEHRIAKGGCGKFTERLKTNIDGSTRQFWGSHRGEGGFGNNMKKKMGKRVTLLETVPGKKRGALAG